MRRRYLRRRLFILPESRALKPKSYDKPRGTFLFSIDLEDVRLMVPNGMAYKEAVPEMTMQYLEFLDAHNSKATFFVVGKVALLYPELIIEIQSQGHEIACHSHSHVPLDKLGKEGFKKDLEENIDALVKLGINQPIGYRAPIFSLTQRTQWAYSILKSCGIQYSSSVLPAHNPLYGWPGFGHEPRMISGVMEIPMTVSELPLFRVPYAGGIYLRVIPFFITRLLLRHNFNKHKPVVSYLHPYEIDYAQERFMHPGINGNRFYNWLMYLNRKKVLGKLDRILDMGCSILPYSQYIESISAENKNKYN